MIRQNYLPEDSASIENNVNIIENSLINILNGVRTGNFGLVEDSQIKIERAKQILYALRKKKLKRDEFSETNNAIYSRRGWITSKSVPVVNLYYFTFGNGHELADYCQPIYAASKEDAEKEMKKIYGLRWAFGYSKEEYEENQKSRRHQKKTLVAVHARGD